MHRPGIFALVPLLFSGLLQACDSDGVGPPEPITELPRDLTLAEEQVIGRSNTFGFDLLKEVDGAREASAPNTILSPLSASMALGMALEGADGETFTAMKEALRFQGLSREEVNASYRGLLDILLDLDPEVELGIANSAWSRLGFPFQTSYFDAVSETFDAEVQELDFDAPGAKDIINGWVDEKTNGRITEIIDVINPLDILYLINAVYFKGSWTTKFKPADTYPGTFHLESGQSVSVPTMSGEDIPIRLGQVDGIQVGELPYGGDAFTMVVVVPPPGTEVSALVDQLDDDTWASWLGSVAKGEFSVRLPKFELEWDGMLKNALSSMGMGPAFVPQADFSRMTPAPDAHISAVRQKTYMKVDEEGTVAAAVTSVTVGVTSVPVGLHVDRPFLVAIRERLTGTVLFLGVIRDPRGS
ncbi:MAG: serpin family protein [Longimicrobiales bacterium]